MKTGYSEVWKHHGKSTLCALIAHDRGWLMYLREEGDSGFSTRNPDILDDSEMIDYYLENGQHDKYPRHWSYPIDIVFRVVDHFERTGEMSDIVKWHQD